MLDFRCRATDSFPQVRSAIRPGWPSVLLACMAFWCCALGEEPRIELRVENGHPIVIVQDLPGELLNALTSDARREAILRGAFYLQVGHAPTAGTPAVLATHLLRDDVLILRPRFGLQRGTPYRVVLDLPLVGRRAQVPLRQERSLEEIVSLPENPTGPPAEVTSIYPSADVLPENLLKFYVHFSAPMRTGDPYRYVRLVDESGREVEHPFVELHQALWDPAGERLTLLLDPGRIKEGLRPREEFGPILRQNRCYTLMIDKAWRDADGRPLAAPYKKLFRVSEPDQKQPDPAKWAIRSPVAATRAHLSVAFDEPLDHAMLLRVLSVVDASGRMVRGEAHVGPGETTWLFCPDAAWSAGSYRLRVETTLEDRAGNSVGRPFEVDVFKTIDTIVEQEFVEIPFSVLAAPAAP